MSLSGRKLSEETKSRISLSLKGKKKNRKSVIKQWITRAGRRTSWFGGKHSEETKRKIGLSNSGAKSNLWRGGISKEKYTVNWTSTLKRSIRERDKYTCQVCFEPQKNVCLAVHHIDYNKKNCNPDNLVSLCNRCHSKTNFNRNKWVLFFKKEMV